MFQFLQVLIEENNVKTNCHFNYLEYLAHKNTQ